MAEPIPFILRDGELVDLGGHVYTIKNGGLQPQKDTQQVDTSIKKVDKAKWDALDACSLFEAGIITRNEARKMIGLDPVAVSVDGYKKGVEIE